MGDLEFHERWRIYEAVVYMAWGDDQEPADGGAFFVLQGDNKNALGGRGASIGRAHVPRCER